MKTHDKRKKCPNCKKRFLPLVVFTHTGGNCPGCGYHIAPEWYSWIMENRETIFGDQSMPMAPWDSMVDVYPDQLDQVSQYKLIFHHMGITIPWDGEKTYWPSSYAEEPDKGYVDITAENAKLYAGMEGVNLLHNALLIICGICTDESGVDRTMAMVAANLIYYATTKMCVGGNHPLEEELERDIREFQGFGDESRFPLFQDAVFYIFDRCGLIHTASVAYGRFEHPRYF